MSGVQGKWGQTQLKLSGKFTKSILAEVFIACRKELESGEDMRGG
jgi:hypothetical protein